MVGSLAQLDLLQQYCLTTAVQRSVTSFAIKSLNRFSPRKSRGFKLKLLLSAQKFQLPAGAMASYPLFLLAKCLVFGSFCIWEMLQTQASRAQS